MPTCPRFTIALFLSLLLLLAGHATAAAETIERPEWAAYFATQGAVGTLLIQDRRTPDAPRTVFNGQRAATRYAPASTFKIPHSLIALDSGVAKDEFSVFGWNGQRHGMDAWNRDQDLRSAMRNSVVWVYQDFARRIGEAKEHNALARLAYGNQRIGKQLDAFWLDGSLRISAHEQIDLLERLYRNDLPFKEAHQRLVKDLMIVEAGRDWILRAKTGWFNRDGVSLGWWVGWVEHPDGPVFFALNLDMPNGLPDAPKREAIARAALQSIGALPARAP